MCWWRQYKTDRARTLEVPVLTEQSCLKRTYPICEVDRLGIVGGFVGQVGLSKVVRKVSNEISESSTGYEIDPIFYVSFVWTVIAKVCIGKE